MAEEIVMPRLSDTMERGTIARWLVHEGDAVHEGDVLAEIETDKATMELNAYSDGVLLRILVQDGEAAELGAPIAVVGAEGEDASGFSAAAGNGDAAAAGGAGETEAAASGETHAAAAPPRRRPTHRRRRRRRSAAPARPASSRRARSRAASPPTPASTCAPWPARAAAPTGASCASTSSARWPAAGRRLRPPRRRPLPPRQRRLRRPRAPPAPPPEADTVIEPEPDAASAVARRMSESKSQVPHFYLQCEIDMGKALALREELNAELADEGVKLTVNDLIVRACALALRDHPQFHRSWIDGKLHQHGAAHVGVAVALDEGLIVPVIRNADSLPLRELAVVARDLVARARSGSLKQHEIEGGTFSVSNLGMLGITSFQAIINPPEPGILAVGSVVERAIGVGGQVVVRPLMTVNLSVDHRAASGADGARLLQTVTRYLEHPLLLLV